MRRPQKYKIYHLFWHLLSSVKTSVIHFQSLLAFSENLNFRMWYPAVIQLTNDSFSTGPQNYVIFQLRDFFFCLDVTPCLCCHLSNCMVLFWSFWSSLLSFGMLLYSSLLPTATVLPRKCVQTKVKRIFILLAQVWTSFKEPIFYSSELWSWLNLAWHDIVKQEKCSSLEPPRVNFYKT